MSTNKIIKILIAAAWIDGEIQPEERDYLHKMATEQNLIDDPEIKLLLLADKPIPSSDCHRWVKEYLGEHPTVEDYRALIGTLGGLIYADGIVEVQEAELLNSLEQLDPTLETEASFSDKFLKILGKFTRKVAYEMPSYEERMQSLRPTTDKNN